MLSPVNLMQVPNDSGHFDPGEVLAGEGMEIRLT